MSALRAPTHHFLQTAGLKGLRLAACLPLLLVLALAHGGDPRIDFIERFGTNLVTLHFDTEANRSYSLQFLDYLNVSTNGALSGSWSNLAVIPAAPFNNHYVWPDFTTSSMRFYRLAVSP